MTKRAFQRLLVRAQRDALAFAEEHLAVRLPLQCRFLVYPNCSYDGNPLKGDEETFPCDDAITDSDPLEFSTPAEVTDFLWRNGKVPEWIDIAVQRFGDEFTDVELMCCGRFSADINLIYWKERTGPFLVCFPGVLRKPSFDWSKWWRED